MSSCAILLTLAFIAESLFPIKQTPPKIGRRCVLHHIQFDDLRVWVIQLAALLAINTGRETAFGAEVRLWVPLKLCTLFIDIDVTWAL